MSDENPSPLDDLLRVLFSDECKRLRCSVIDKSHYDEIIAVLRGQVRDKEVLRKHRNAALRYALVEFNGEFALTRKKESSSDQRRLVHSIELYGILSSAQRDSNSTSSHKLFEYISKRYANISHQICVAYMRCHQEVNRSEPRRQGFFSVIDMSTLAEDGNLSRFVLLYQDFPSRRIYSRELRYGSAKGTAGALLKIFIRDGPPDQLYSNSKRKFNRKVLDHISSIEPTYNIQLSRGSFWRVHLQNEADFKSKLKKWLVENGRVGWTYGIYYCADSVEKRPMDLQDTSLCFQESSSKAQGGIEEAMASSLENTPLNTPHCEASESCRSDSQDVSNNVDESANHAEPMITIIDEGIIL